MKGALLIRQLRWTWTELDAQPERYVNLLFDFLGGLSAGEADALEQKATRTRQAGRR